MKALLAVATCMFAGFALLTTGLFAATWPDALLLCVLGLLTLLAGAVIAVLADVRGIVAAKPPEASGQRHH